MAPLTAERRRAPRYHMVLAAEVVELPRGAKFCARTADMSRSGCYIDTMNPMCAGSQVRLRITHHAETFQATGNVVYASHGLGMGIHFQDVQPEEHARLDRWLAETGQEF